MKVKAIIFIFVCVWSIEHIYAQKQVWNADTIMERVRNTERTYYSIETRLDMTIIAKDSSITYKTSELAWQKGRMNMSNRDTAGTLTFQIIQVEDTIWSYNLGMNEVNINYDKKQKDIITGLGMSTISFYGSQGPVIKEIIGDTIAVISVYPINPDRETWNKIEIRINLKSYQLMGYTKFQKDGGQTICKLKYTSINQPLDPDLFRFNLKNYPAGTKVIDNRIRKK